MKKKVFIYATEHADMVWRRCFDRDFTFEGRNFVSYSDLEAYYIIDSIKICKKNKEYRFNIESVAMLKKFLEKYPQHEEDIQKLLKNGQVQMPFSGNNIVDSNMVNGEGIIRNYLYGYEYLKNKYNFVPYGMDRNDAFGNSAQLPQIARKFGTKWIYHLTYNSSDGKYWRGLDGSVVSTWEPKQIGYTGGYYKYRPCPACNGFRDKDCDVCNNRRIDTAYMENMRVILPDTLPDFDDKIPPRIYCGGEEILPSEHVVEWARKNADKYDVTFGGYDDYLEYISDVINSVDNPPEDKVHNLNEFNCNNTGTYVTRIKTKQTVRENENHILTTETVAVADFLKNRIYPYADFEKIWEKYFFTIFHDSITATHVDVAYDEIMDCTKQIAEDVKSLRVKLLADKAQYSDDKITVYNPYGSTVTAEVTVNVTSHDDVFIADDSGNKVVISEYEKLEDEIAITFSTGEIKPFSKREYKTVKTDTPFNMTINQIYELDEFKGMPVLTNEQIKDDNSNNELEIVIENENFKIIAIDSGIKEIFDKKLGCVISKESEYMVGEWVLEHDEGSPWATHSTDMRRRGLSVFTHLISTEETENVKKITFLVRPGDVEANAVMGLKIQYSIILKKNSDRIDFVSDVFWHTQNYRLRIAIPVLGDSKHFYEIPYGVTERKPYEHTIVFPDGATNWASAAGDYPAINWAGAQAEKYSLAMFNKGTPSYQINKDSKDNSVIYLSVLRSPSLGSYLYSPTEYTMTDYDGMRDAGEHHFEYAIKAYDKGFDENNAVLDGVSYNAQMVVQNGIINIEQLPVLISEDARISSIKMSQDKKSIVLRIVEYHGKDTKGTIVIPDKINYKSVWEADLKEDKIKELSVVDDRVDIDINHFEIKTICIDV